MSLKERLRKRKQDKELFLNVVQSIYGNAELDSRTMAQLQNTWKTNPELLIQTAKLKNTPATLDIPSVERTVVLTVPESLPIRDIVIKLPISDDFSGMSFTEAFSKARLSGLDTFKWNSGVYGTLLTKPGEVTMGTEPSIELPEVVSVPENNTPVQSIELPEVVLTGNTNNTANDIVVMSTESSGIGGNLLKKAIAKTMFDLNFPTLRLVRDAVISYINAEKTNRGGHDNYIYLAPGRTTQFQQGGQLNMNEQQLQQAFIQYLAQKTGAKTQQELEAAILQLGEEGLKLAYAEFMQLIQQQLVQAAKFGAKLNYIKLLRGQCPEGYEISYYKIGGTLCKKCKKKEMKNGGTAPKDAVDEFKLNRTKKKAQGGGVNLNNGKCPKKKENGGELNSTLNPKSYSKMALAKCGTKLKEACKGVKVSCLGSKVKSNATGGAVSGKKLCKKKASGGTVSTPLGTYSDSKGTQWKPGKRYNPKG